MPDSNNNSPSVDSNNSDQPDAQVPSGLSLSRRVKIGVVLFLTLCGYFLMDDRPQPVALSTAPEPTAGDQHAQMQQFMNDLEFVDTTADQQSIPQNPIRLPETETGASVAATAPPAAPAIPDNPPTRIQQTVADAQPALQSHQHRLYQTYSSGPDVRTVLRFTGRIEPLQ